MVIANGIKHLLKNNKIKIGLQPRALTIGHFITRLPRYFSLRRLETILSSPLKAPDETNRMLVVSTWRKTRLVKFHEGRKIFPGF